jgi:diaminopimelate decarboxylase/aspartate kinase
VTAVRVPPFFVLKFGGTSVARPHRWEQIARIVRAHIERGEHPVLVCSALSGVTNELEALIAAVESGQPPTGVIERIWAKHVELARALGLDAEAILGERLSQLTELAAATDASPAWQAKVLSRGELMSTALGAAYLREVGIRAEWVDARTILRAQEEDALASDAQRYLSATCGHEPNTEAQERLHASGAQVSVTQGFIAHDDDGETVVLGRGGSDTSAAYLAASLSAQRLEIWTDVPGLFTIDPRKTDQARLVPEASYDEAAVMGALGAKVLHPRCLGPVRAAGIPLAIRWTDRPEVDGTVIGADAESGIKAVSTRSSLCLVKMQRDRRWQPVGFMAEVSACFHRHGLSMDLISSSSSEIRATIDLGADPGAAELVPELLRDLDSICEPELIRDVTCLSVIGSGISAELPRIAGVMKLLGEPEVHLVSHAADDTHVSYVLDASVADELGVTMHDELFERPSDSPVRLGRTWQRLNAKPRARRSSTRRARA